MASRTRHRLESRIFRIAIERFGAQIDDTWILEVPGRRTGVRRFTPVKVLQVDGERHLVSLPGHTEWARNLRAAGEARLRQRGRILPVRAEELPPAERPPVLRAYLAAATRARTLDLLGAGSRDPDDAHLRRIAADHPVFHLIPTETTMIDTSEMNVVHVVFRREFRALPELVRAVPAGDTARADVVRRHAEFMLWMLTHHHQAEDAALWPALAGRVPTDLVELMEQQHRRAHGTIEAIGPTLSRWRAAGVADRDELAVLLGRLHAVLIEHLDAEEQRMLPVAAATLTPEQWEHFRAVGRSGSIARVPLIVGMLRYEADPERFRAMMADIPAPMRGTLLWLAGRSFRRFALRVYGTATPPRLDEAGHAGPPAMGATTSGAARWALVSGAAGLIAGLTLILFFALAAPFDDAPSRWDWLGPANDLTGALQSAALVPVALALLRLMPEPGGVRGWTTVGVAAMGIGSALGVALVLGLLPFAVQAPLVTFCIAVQFGWVFSISRAGLRLGVLPSTVARTGVLVGLAFGVSAALAVAALLLPWGSTVQYLLFGVAALPGVLAWLGFPVWTLQLARHVLSPGPPARPRSDEAAVRRRV